MNRDVTVRCFLTDDKAAFLHLNEVYLKRYPSAELVTEDMLASPVYEGGANVLCAFTPEGQLAGYVPLYPHYETNPEIPHIVWTNIVVEPDYPDDRMIRDLLLHAAVPRVKELVAGHPANLCFQNHIAETKAIEYVESIGAEYTDSVLRMKRRLTEDMGVYPVPEGIVIRTGNPESDEEINAWVAARNEALGMPETVEDFRHFLDSVIGGNGTMVIAFDGEEVIGSVSPYWFDEEHERFGVKFGWTESVFVREAWRGRGIADAMLSEACLYLRDHGMKEAWLDPGAANKRAIRVYSRCGYRITDESRQYKLQVC